MAKRFDSPIVDDTDEGPGDYPNSDGPAPLTEQQDAEVVRLIEGEPFDAKAVKQLNGQGAGSTPDSAARDYQPPPTLTREETRKQMSEWEAEDKAEAEATTSGPRLVAVNMALVEPVEVEWLWYPYLPATKLTIMEGAPGLGKSYLSLSIASALSHGKIPATNQDLPDGPQRVLIFTAEDALDDTVKPRLELLGADQTKINAVGARTEETEEGDQYLSLDPDGLAVLDNTLRHYKPALVIIDPLVAYLGPDLDMHRANETRRVFTALGNISTSNKCAMMLIRHTKKSAKDGSAINAGIGSIDIIAAVRSSLLVGEYHLTADDGSEISGNALTHSKHNLSPAGDSLGYYIDGQYGLVWGGVLPDVRDHDLLGAPPRPRGRPNTKTEAATEWLKQFLADGPRPSAEVKECAQVAGHSDYALEQAKTILGIKSEKGTGASHGVWVWTPPWNQQLDIH